MPDDVIQKVDRILVLLEGTKHNPGVLERVETTERILNGVDGAAGLVQKVNFMWRFHIWFIGGIGTLLGSVITYAASHVK